MKNFTKGKHKLSKKIRCKPYPEKKKYPEGSGGTAVLVATSAKDQ